MTALTWHGLTGDYTDDEREFMRTLAANRPDEAAVIHELKALLDARSVPDAPVFKAPVQTGDVYVYAWGNSERRQELKGRRCVIEAWGGRMRTVLVRFLDNGERVTTSRRALRKAA